MSDMEATAAFAAFREAVHDDFHLMLRVRQPLAREAYVSHVVAVGAECGFAFDETAVRTALREGEGVWLMQGAD